MTTYRTITGRLLDLGGLTAKERGALTEVEAIYARRPDWTEFSREWQAILRKRVWGRGKAQIGTAIYLACQDMEGRIGIAQGDVAPPDYRDRLADLIEEKFGSRYAFCQATGIDQGNLSHVLAGRKDFSLDMLRVALDALGVQLDLVSTAEVLEDAKALADEEPAARLLRMSNRIAALERSRRRGRSADELRSLLQEQSKLARQIAKAADARRAAVSD